MSLTTAQRARPRLALPLVLGLSLLAACGGQPEDALTWRESWEFLGLDEAGGVVDARVTVSNTGLLRGQAHLRADRYSRSGDPIHYGRDVAPVEVTLDPAREAVGLGYDGMARGEDPAVPDRWTLRARDAEARVLLHADPVAPAAAGAEATPRAAWMTADRQWAVEATLPHATMTGWLSAGRRGGLVEARGVVLHRGGDGRPTGPRTTILVFGRQGMVALDLHGDQGIAWTVDDQGVTSLALPTAPVHVPPDALAEGPHAVAFPGGPTLALTLDGVAGAHPPLAHLTLLEQRLAGWAGRWRTRTLRRGVATIDWGDGTDPDQGPALWLTVAAAPWAPVERPELVSPTGGPAAGGTPSAAGGPPP